MTNKPDITYRLTTREPVYTLTNDDLVEAANEIVDLRAKVQLLELQYSVLLAKYDNAAALLDENDSAWESEAEQIYCDHCGDAVDSDKVIFFHTLPQDIASANKGESATTCRKCCEMIDANANNEYFKKNHR